MAAVNEIVRVVRMEGSTGPLDVVLPSNTDLGSAQRVLEQVVAKHGGNLDAVMRVLEGLGFGWTVIIPGPTWDRSRVP